MRRHVEICRSLAVWRYGPSRGARRLNRISRVVRRFSSWRQVPASTSLVLIASALAGTIGGLGPSSAAADVFTNFSLPTITGNAVEGQTLSEEHATWSSPPAAYAYQWQRCNSSGNDCSSIPKARAQTYRLAAADVGFRIRVGESARDAEGAVTPSMSEPTAVVQALASEEHSSVGGSSGGGSQPGACCTRPTPNESAEIEASLGRELAPSGKTTSISALLKHGGLRASFKFPEPGTLLVKWYLKAPGAKLELVAVGQAKVTAGQTIGVGIRLTAEGRMLLAHARKLQLEATGTFTPKGAKAIRVTRKLSLKR
jgi:hypothetical protein